ncbi:MAG TPA: VOC family protein, partial [Gemmatimonadaceae bacterium]
TIAVKNLEASRKFYEGALGLKIAEQQPGVITYSSGRSRVFVYESQFAGTNKATAATWRIGAGEIEEIVQTLKSKGVPFEHYAMPGLTLEGDIHVGEGMKVAWCKDPDGNILSLVSG